LPTASGPAMLRSDTRSMSYSTASDEQGGPSKAYANTLDNIRRMRSTRMDKHISTTTKKARTSRIIDGPEGRSARPGSAGADGSDSRNHGFQIVEDKDADGQAVTELTFGNQDALTLDDIPRIVAAEQAREQRPNAYRHGAKHIFEPSRSEKARLINGHQRGGSGGHELDAPVSGEPPIQRGKKYFSELSALEYFIVRHVAVLSMEPLLEGHFNLEELLGLIESRKPTFWGKFGKAFKNDGKRAGKKKGVFGVALDVLIEKDGAECTFGVGPGALRIPALIDDAVSAMRQMDMSVEGVFRKNGNIRRLKELAETIDSKGSEAVDLTKEPPVQVAALLKKFLRELPDPMLTFKLHRLFITSQSKTHYSF
jgi:RhoGAP domain